MKRNRRVLAAAAALAAGSLMLTACSSVSSSASSSASGSAAASSTASASPSDSQEIPTKEQFCKDTVLIWNAAALQSQSPKDSTELSNLIMMMVAGTQELSVADEVGALDAVGAERIQRTMAITLVLMQDQALASKSSAEIAKATGMTTAQVDEAKTQAFKDAARKDYGALTSFCAGVLGTASPAASAPASASASAS